jgi:hypothetical protein
METAFSRMIMLLFNLSLSAGISGQKPKDQTASPILHTPQIPV